MNKNKKPIGTAFFLTALAIAVLSSMNVFAEETSTPDLQGSTPMYFFDNFAMYMIIIFGIFASLAFMVVTYIVYRGQGFFGPWIIFSIIAILFLFSEFTLDNIVIHRRFVASIMFLFFAAALFRYWDAIELSQ